MCKGNLKGLEGFSCKLIAKTVYGQDGSFVSVSTTFNNQEIVRTDSLILIIHAIQ